MKRKTILVGVVAAAAMAIVAVLVFSSKAPSNESSNAPAGVYVPGINIQILEFSPQFGADKYGKIYLDNIEITAKNLNSHDLDLICGYLRLYDMENNKSDMINLDNCTNLTSNSTSLPWGCCIPGGATNTLKFYGQFHGPIYYNYNKPLTPNATYTVKLHLEAFPYRQGVSGDYTTTFTVPELPAE